MAAPTASDGTDSARVHMEDTTDNTVTPECEPQHQTQAQLPAVDSGVFDAPKNPNSPANSPRKSELIPRGTSSGPPLGFGAYDLGLEELETALHTMSCAPAADDTTPPATPPPAVSAHALSGCQLLAAVFVCTIPTFVFGYSIAFTSPVFAAAASGSNAAQWQGPDAYCLEYTNVTTANVTIAQTRVKARLPPPCPVLRIDRPS